MVCAQGRYRVELDQQADTKTAPLVVSAKPENLLLTLHTAQDASLDREESGEGSEEQDGEEDDLAAAITLSLQQFKAVSRLQHTCASALSSSCICN